MKHYIGIGLLMLAFAVAVMPARSQAQTGRVQQNLQWVYSALVPYNTDVNLDGAPQMAWNSETWGYTIPANKWLGITQMQYGSKFTKDYYSTGQGQNRASYFVIENIATVPDTVGVVMFHPPLAVQPNVTLHVHFINNNLTEAEWMTSVVQAVLIDPPPNMPFYTYRDVFPGVIY